MLGTTKLSPSSIKFPPSPTNSQDTQNTKGKTRNNQEGNHETNNDTTTQVAWPCTRRKQNHNQAQQNTRGPKAQD